MIFLQLCDPKYFVYLSRDANGMVCYRGDTPDDIQREFEEINAEHKKYIPSSRDFILMLDGNDPDYAE